MLNWLVAHMKERASVNFTTTADAAREWKRKASLESHGGPMNATSRDTE